MRRGQDFDVAVRRGRRVGRRTLVVHAVAGPPATDPDLTGDVPVRVGFVVSRAVGPSVVRSRVKRRLRAVTAERIDRLPAGWLLVVRANPAASSASSADLAVDLEAALARLGKSSAGAGGVPDRTGGVTR